MAGKVDRRVINDSSSKRRRVALRLLDSLPSALLKKVLFGSSRLCMLLQVAVQHLLAGPFSAQVEFTAGLLRGKIFECSSGEKYFLLGSSFEQATQTLLQERVKTGDVVYDVGAHAGFMTLLFSILCGPSGHVFAFEPSPVNFARLQLNVELNRESGVTLVSLAASNTEGSAILAEIGSYSCLVTGVPRPGETYSETHSIRLDDFVYRDGHPAPRFLKIDIEGHAGQCLEGATEILLKASPVLFCEIHHVEEMVKVRHVLGRYSYSIAEVHPSRGFPQHVVATPCGFPKPLKEAITWLNY